MKNTKAILSAILFAGAALSSQVTLADDISHAPQTLMILDGTADFGAAFAAGNFNDTFADRFTFTTSGINNVGSLVSSISRTETVGLEITGFALYDSMNTLVTNGIMMAEGAIDLWQLTTNNLVAGDYYVQVSGRLVSDTSAAFGANITLAPVPEPETYGMMLAGLGVLGFLSRRRRKQDAEAA